VGRARFDALEGHDEAVWSGYTSFDPRPIAADVAAFRTAARELLRVGNDGPQTLVIATDGRQAGAFAAARRARSVLVRVGTGEAWTAPVRIAVAAEVLHAWIGERLWIGPDDAAHEAEAYWFTEGVTRYLARDLEFRFGLVTSREMLDEVHRLLGIAATSPWKGARNAEVAARAKQAGAVPLLVARGALYATALRARIRARSGGKRGLEDVLRALFEKARAARGPLPVSAWIEAVSAEAGAGEAALFARAIEEGKLDDLPEDALGPCFRRAPRTYEAFDLGFDEDATRAAADRKIAGLRAGGPADRAGLREGDVLVEAVVARGRSDVPVTLTVERGGEKKTIKYTPAGARVKGMGFTRKSDVPEEACAK
jgi:predicted metalloprotease with PDZ domain